MTVVLANAPVSYGVFELGATAGAELPGPEELCRLVAAAGYSGIDSGPIGMLGRGRQLRDRLSRHGLSLAGGWVDLPFAEPDAFEAALPGYRQALEFFADATGGPLSPRPTLACSGSAARRAQPGGHPELMLSEQQWDGYGARVQQAVELAESMGLSPTFHHHACTFVETPEEIRELLARTTVGLTLDTGHLLLGGGDPLTGLGEWSDRIDHLHLKDSVRAVLDRVVAARGDMREIWTSRVFVPLGEGDLDLAGVMDWVTGSGYAGWLVVEQDVVPSPGDPPDRPQREQIHNREVLRRWFP